MIYFRGIDCGVRVEGRSASTNLSDGPYEVMRATHDVKDPEANLLQAVIVVALRWRLCLCQFVPVEAVYM